MHLSDLKNHHVTDLVQMAVSSEIEGANRLRKQELIFALLKNHAKKGETIYGEGTLEVLQDGFGFLRSPDYHYLSCPDDIYVSPSQIRRFGLRTGSTVSGQIRPPKESERYFALLRVEAKVRVPRAFRAFTTSGCTRPAGWVPAEIARACDGFEYWLKRAAAICDRPALCTQAKSTVITAADKRSTDYPRTRLKTFAARLAAGVRPSLRRSYA